jgi:dihydrolipoamide dehydrogenase
MGEQFDMAVVGGGPGGYVAALRGRQLGLTVALVEKERVGGVCLNRGCIPTKTLLADVEGLLWCRRAVRDGIIDREPVPDFSRMMSRKSNVVESLVSNLEKLIEGSGIKLFRGCGRIPEPGIVLTDTGDTIHARSLVIATGSRSRIPPIPGADLPGVVTTREILSIETVPKQLIIIGGGVIGQEFAGIFAALGVKVTILEALDRILNEADGEIARRYAGLIQGRGITTETGAFVRIIERTDHGLRAVYEKRGKEKIAEGDLVLLATGRAPFLQGLLGDRPDLRMRNGALDVDDHLRTSVAGIYAIGDVVGRKMLAHVASYHGELVAENVAGADKAVDEKAVPACVFTSPQIAWVGMTEEEASRLGRPFRTSVLSLAASGKALAMGEPRGLFKLIEDGETGNLVGAHLIGPQVSELIGELTLAVSKGLSVKDIAHTIHAHPTLAETLKETALGFLDGPIHAAARVKSVSGTTEG